MLIATMTYSTKHQDGKSAMSLAVGRGDVDVMKVLIEGGADVQDKVIVYRSLHYIYTVAMCDMFNHRVFSIIMDTCTCTYSS